MKFVWDEPKRLANIEKHGLDFADLEAAFSWDRFLATEIRMPETQRLRYRFVGKLFDRTVVAIVSPLGSEALAIISLRVANKRERSVYEQSF